MADMDTKTATDRAMWAHIIPFAAWMGLMLVLGSSAGSYAIRSVVCLGLFLALRPWRGYAALRPRNLLPALAVGVVVFIAWVLPESRWMARWPAAQELYLKVGMLPAWLMPKAPEGTPFAPDTCGWPLSLARLLGSAFVIALIEEFFWRGFLYRWLQGRDFTAVDIGRWHLVNFAIVCGLFALEHDRWIAGAIAGAAYGLLTIRTRDIWAACAAHATTNLLLGIYVLATASYAFW